MELSFHPYTLTLRGTFTISTYSRTTTPGILVELRHDGLTGYGEASLPQYLGETVDNAAKFLSRVDLSQFKDPLMTDDILTHVAGIDHGHCAAKAAIDIALHDLAGKIIGQPCHKLLGLDKAKAPATSYTIGIGSPNETRGKVREAAAKYKILKVKLGTDHDRQIIETIRQETDLPITVDANQGWRDPAEAIDMAHWLAGQGTLLIEQPFPREDLDMTARLSEASPIPIIADEAVQRATDIPRLHGAFDGINIKLMKCTGMHEAWSMVATARSLGMRVMLGCMTETSCAISAAAQLSPAVDFADLDGNLLISNDPFHGVTVSDGRLVLNDAPGIGVRPAERQAQTFTI